MEVILNKRNFSLEIPQKFSFYNIVSEIGTFITYTKGIWIFAPKINIRMYNLQFFYHSWDENSNLWRNSRCSFLKELLLPWTLKWVLKIACSAWYASFPNENWSYLPHTSVEKIEIIKFRFCIRSVKNFSRKRIRKTTFWSTHWHKFSWSMTLCKLFFLSSD